MLIDAINFEGVIDGELLVGGTARSNSATRTFSDLQQRLNRKTVNAKMLSDYPAFVRAYDTCCSTAMRIFRARTYLQRREELAEVIDKAPHDRFDISPLVEFQSWCSLIN